MKNIINSSLNTIKYGLQGVNGEIKNLKNSSQNNVKMIKEQNLKLVKEIRTLKSHLGRTVSKIVRVKSNKKRTHKRRTHKRRTHKRRTNKRRK